MPPLAALAVLLAAYGHSWRWRNDPPASRALLPFVADFRRLAAARRELVEEHVIEGEPALLYELNGVGDGAGEPFRWPGAYGLSECHTGGKPYDAVVTAALIRIGESIPPDMLIIESDGTWDDWAKGRALYEEVFGRPAKDPISALRRRKVEIDPPYVVPPWMLPALTAAGALLAVILAASLVARRRSAK